MFFNDINTFIERYDDALIKAHQKFNEVGCFAPIDFYVDTVLKRAMVINGAYVKLAKANNYIAAAPYIRMQMDNCIYFVHTSEHTNQDLINIILDYYYKEGIEYFFYDTLKTDIDNIGNVINYFDVDEEEKEVKVSKKSIVSNQCLNVFRNLGLALFFVGTGFSTGTQDIAFDIRSILYGILITLSAIACGWVLCKLVERKHSLHEGFIIAGGMTSSPAYGVLSSITTKSSVNCFSFSYFGALISLIVAIQFICN